MSESGTCLFRLDHVSLAVPDLSTAIEELEQRLGLAAVRTAAEPHHHGRIFLDRSYLEVSDREPGEGWRRPYFFLRFEDPAAARQHLETSGLAWTWGSYQGVDGRWDDVFIQSGSVPCPILVRRTEPLDLARDWPPALSRAHRCDATTLHEVRVGVVGLENALEVYSRLLGTAPEPVRISATADGALYVLAGGGRIVLLESDVSGIQSVTFGVASLRRSWDFLGGLAELGSDQTLWTNPAAAHGLRWGFAEAPVVDRLQDRVQRRGV